MTFVDKLLVLVVTGFPGIHKLLSLALVGKLFGAEDLGGFSSDISIVYTLSMFSAIGIGAVLLKEIPGKTYTKAMQTLNAALAGSTFICLATIPVIMALHTYGIVQQTYSLLFYYGSYSAIQIKRHYDLAQKNYKRLLLLDIATLLAITTCILIARDLSDIFAWLSVFQFLILSVFCGIELRMVDLKKNRLLFVPRNSIRYGFQFSLSCLVGGGVVMLLPPAVMQLAGAKVAGTVAIYASIISMFMLFIRAYSNYRLPDLVINLKKNKHDQQPYLCRLRLELFIVLAISMLTAFLAYAPAQYFLAANSTKSYYIYSLLVLLNFSGAVSILESNYLFVINKQIHNLISNILFFVGFVLSYISCTFFKGQIRLEMFILGLIVFSLLRYPYLSSKVKLAAT